MDEPANREITGRNPDGTFKEGVSGNPNGRPKGTLKEHLSLKFRAMSAEEKDKWLKDHYIDALDVWKMAEGNPSTHTDLTSMGGPLFSAEHKQKADEAIRALTSDTE